MLAAVDSGEALIWAAYLAAGPAALAAFASWRNSVLVKRQLRPSNGHKLSEIIEKTQNDVETLKTDLAYHVSVQHGRGPIPQGDER